MRRSNFESAILCPKILLSNMHIADESLFQSLVIFQQSQYISNLAATEISLDE